MSAVILDGKILAAKIKEQLKSEVKILKEKTGCVPCLVNVMIGDDSGSCAYANSQKRVAEQIGIEYQLKSLPHDIPQEKFISTIESLNADKDINGIMIHKPVPKHIDYHAVTNYVGIHKDLEGINVANIGKMLLGETDLIPCTPAAVMAHIQSTRVSLEGKEVVIVGHSDIVGKPLSLLLVRELATVTICHIGTSQAGKLVDHVSRADILIVAVGKAGLIKGDWIKPGAIVIDVGINKTGATIQGDVEFESAKARAAFITPVPGGVGPVTVTMLMKNGIEAFKLQLEGKGR